MIEVPSSPLTDEMYRRPSAPFTASSIGVVTADSTSEAFAPGYVELIVIVGGEICGNCAIGNVGIATMPIVKRIAEQTAAKIGRDRKKRDMDS